MAQDLNTSVFSGTHLNGFGVTARTAAGDTSSKAGDRPMEKLIQMITDGKLSGRFGWRIVALAVIYMAGQYIRAKFFLP